MYFFGSSQVDGDRTMRDLLGGKGAGLAEMTRAGLPVPPGFTVSTDVCRLFYSAGRRVPQRVEDEMESHLRRLEKLSGTFLGADDRPALGFSSVWFKVFNARHDGYDLKSWAK